VRVPNFRTPETEIAFLVEWYNHTSGWTDAAGWSDALATASSEQHIDCTKLTKNNTKITCPSICNMTAITGVNWTRSMTIANNVYNCSASKYNLVQVGID
jgi:hypothetical protein